MLRCGPGGILRASSRASSATSFGLRTSVGKSGAALTIWAWSQLVHSNVRISNPEGVRTCRARFIVPSHFGQCSLPASDGWNTYRGISSGIRLPARVRCSSCKSTRRSDGGITGMGVGSRRNRHRYRNKGDETGNAADNRQPEDHAAVLPCSRFISCIRCGRDGAVLPRTGGLLTIPELIQRGFFSESALH